jgi:hypothetical protein
LTTGYNRQLGKVVFRAQVIIHFRGLTHKLYVPCG